jgi:DNA polymerase-1
VSGLVAWLVAHGIRRAWVGDTEYKSVEGGLQIPHCLCALDLITRERVEIMLEPDTPCPFSMAKDELFFLFAADADILTFIAMKSWPIPLIVIDPRVEWIRIDNGGDQYKPGRPEKKGYSLLDAARTYRVPATSEGNKKYWRDVAIRGGPFTREEQQGLLRYCRTDVDLTARVLVAMWEDLGLSDPCTFQQALIRGRYLAAAASCYATGIPLCMPDVKRMTRYAREARLGLIQSQANIFPVYRSDGTFSHQLFARLLRRYGQLASWPRTPTGAPSTSEKAFEKATEAWPLAGEMGRFRSLLDQLKTFDLPIGPDGRARVNLRAFGTKSGRNNTAQGGGFIFALNSTFRHLVQAPRGRALIAVDWSSQELHIAARLSRDPKLIEIVTSGRDPYIELAIMVALAAPGSDEQSDPEARGKGKIIQLALLYGAGPGLIARATNMSPEQSRAFLKRQRQIFHRFFAWSDHKAQRAVTCKTLTTQLGWTIRFRPGTSTKSPERTGRNFCVQGSAADMMRLLMIRVSEAGVAICAAIHDGFLFECDERDVEQTLAIIKAAMDKSALDLIGATIPFKLKVFRSSERYSEGKTQARELFDTIMRMVGEAKMAPMKVAAE